MRKDILDINFCLEYKLCTGGRNMNNKQMKMMKKIVEEKKQKGNNVNKNAERPKKVIGRMLLHSGRTTL